MEIVTLVFWLIGIALTYSGLVLAILAASPGRHWLIVPAAVPVALALGIGLFGGVTPPNPLLAIAVGLGLGLVGVIGGSGFVSLLLGAASRESARLGAHGGILVRDATSALPMQREILRGGTTIGYLERFALIGSVLAGQAAAVAVIVAVKGLGRYSELENEQARERFIIGTLASLVWAAVCTAAIFTVT